MVIRRKQDLINHITDYLANGGLFNPEYMTHDQVNFLLMDIRDYLMSNQVMDIEHIPTPPATGTHKCFLCGVTGANGLACPAHNCPSRVAAHFHKDKERFLAGEERIRTYHEPDNRVTDHASGFTSTYNDVIIKGNIGDMIEARAKVTR